MTSLITADPSRSSGPAFLADARAALWQALMDRDEFAAGRAVRSAVDAGAEIEDVLLDVIAPTQARVGAEWAAARIGVAQEHAATAINDRVIADLPPRAAPRSPAGPGPRVTVACVDGEWHALPARLLAEVLRRRGFRVDFLGAQVPTAHLVAHLHETGPDAVALSSSIATRLPTAHAAITACQAIGVPVLAGGAAFGPHGRYARLLGADAWAPDGRAAAAAFGEGPPRTRPRPTQQAVDDLPHLTDQEYTLVARGRRALVRATAAGLEERLPFMRGYTEPQREHTAQDVAHIVDFLAVSLYVDDADLFSGFLAWTADILEARGVPSSSLPPALDLLAGELTDFPRATRHLAHGRAALGSRPSPPLP